MSSMFLFEKSNKAETKGANSVKSIGNEDMASDSSSSDEDDEKFKEAIDSSLLSNKLYSKSEVNDNNERSGDNILPSLRNQTRTVAEHINPFTIKVTPEFRKHVSKHLSKILDETIKEVKVKQLPLKKNVHKSEGGVKLLRNSKNYFQANVTEVLPKRYYHGRPSHHIDYEKRAKQVAVSGEWVFSQKETEHWAKSNKGEVEVIKYKKPNAH